MWHNITNLTFLPLPQTPKASQLPLSEHSVLTPYTWLGLNPVLPMAWSRTTLLESRTSSSHATPPWTLTRRFSSTWRHWILTSCTTSLLAHAQLEDAVVARRLKCVRFPPNLKCSRRQLQRRTRRPLWTWRGSRLGDLTESFCLMCCTGEQLRTLWRITSQHQQIMYRCFKARLW